MQATRSASTMALRTLSLPNRFDGLVGQCCGARIKRTFISLLRFPSGRLSDSLGIRSTFQQA